MTQLLCRYASDLCESYSKELMSATLGPRNLPWWIFFRNNYGRGQGSSKTWKVNNCLISRNIKISMLNLRLVNVVQSLIMKASCSNQCIFNSFDKSWNSTLMCSVRWYIHQRTTNHSFCILHSFFIIVVFASHLVYKKHASCYVVRKGRKVDWSASRALSLLFTCDSYDCVTLAVIRNAFPVINSY